MLKFAKECELAKFIVSLILLSFSLSASPSLAQEPVILTFKAWKDQQLIEARNQVVRLTNQLTLSKAGKSSAPDIAPRNEDPAAAGAEALELTRVQKSSATSRVAADLKRALDTFHSAKELSLEDYFVVYLVRFRNQPEALESFAQRLSKEEMIELLKVILNRGRSSMEAATPKSALGGLVAGDHAH